jgi:glutamine---fructose-6-phosphate transaminase (isomerizing)
MFDTVRIIQQFDVTAVKKSFTKIKTDSRLFLTGEGSSRIFPAKNMRHHQLMIGGGPEIFIEGGAQLLDYPLEDYCVIGASNSGKTKEIITLFSHLKSLGHTNLYAVTCNNNTPLQELANKTVIINN